MSCALRQAREGAGKSKVQGGKPGAVQVRACDEMFFEQYLYSADPSSEADFGSATAYPNGGLRGFSLLEISRVT